MANGLTHFDKEGNAVMVDVSGKSITYRTALATGYISVGPEIMTCVTEGNVKKVTFSVWHGWQASWVSKKPPN